MQHWCEHGIAKSSTISLTSARNVKANWLNTNIYATQTSSRNIFE